MLQLVVQSIASCTNPTTIGGVMGVFRLQEGSPPLVSGALSKKIARNISSPSGLVALHTLPPLASSLWHHGHQISATETAVQFSEHGASILLETVAALLSQACGVGVGIGVTLVTGAILMITDELISDAVPPPQKTSKVVLKVVDESFENKLTWRQRMSQNDIPGIAAEWTHTLVGGGLRIGVTFGGTYHLTAAIRSFFGV